MRQRRCTGTAFDTDEPDGARNRRFFGVGEDRRNGFDDLHRSRWRNDIFVDALTLQLAIERHIVRRTADDDLGVGITNLSERFELVKDCKTRFLGFQDQRCGVAVS